jgi:ankyrin repeat protein
VTEEWSESEKGIFNAVTAGDIETVKQLLETTGLDVSLKDSEGMTPLHFATDRGHLEVVQALLQHGAIVDSLNSDGQTPIMIAITCEHVVSPHSHSHRGLVHFLLGNYQRASPRRREFGFE